MKKSFNEARRTFSEMFDTGDHLTDAIFRAFILGWVIFTFTAIFIKPVLRSIGIDFMGYLGP